MNLLSVEYLESLSPEEVATALATARDAVNFSKGFAVYEGEKRDIIIARYDFIRMFIMSKLTDFAKGGE